jgi:hypothetical protein
MRWAAPLLLLSSATGCGEAVAAASSSSNSVVCPQPSVANVLQATAFDRDLSGWQVVAGDGTVSWSSDDAIGCPGSGSAQITLTGSTSPRLEQCAPVQPDTIYNFGVRLRTTQGGDTHCTVAVYDKAACAGDSEQRGRASWVNTAWSTIAVGGPVITKPTSRSARVSCYVEEAKAMFIDAPYLTPSPWAY